MTKSKIYLIVIFFCCSVTASFAQGVGINNTNSEPDPSAMLDVSSTIGGMLIPRLTQDQRDAISDPATGLMIYQVDNIPGFYHYNGTSWKLVGSKAFSIDDLWDGMTVGNSVYLGRFAGNNDDSTNNQNVAIGKNAMVSNIFGSYNAATGFGSLSSNIGGHGNTATGFRALNSNILGNNNTGLGYMANQYNVQGDSNTIIGSQAGRGSEEHSKYGNVFIGFKAGYNDTTDNKLYIENSASSTPLIWGDFENDLLGFNAKVGIGTNSPSSSLEVIGKIQTDTIFSPVFASYISPLYFQIFGNTHMFISLGGQIGIGTVSPSSSALVDMTSSTKGFLPPRMTGTQRDAISNPAEGLSIYNTDTKSMQFYNGDHWRDYTLLSSADVVCGSDFIDTRDGQTYKTVQIGDQCWMAENLKIGTMVANASPYQTDNDTIEKYCYNNLESNCDIYGGYYQWDEMMVYSTTEGIQGICPTGWHLPIDNEWKVLEGYVDTYYPVGDPVWDMSGFRGVNAGTRLKSIASGWYGSDNYDFSVLPLGFANVGSFGGYGWSAYFWTSTVYDVTQAWYRGFLDEEVGVERSVALKTKGYNVRCLKD